VSGPEEGETRPLPPSRKHCTAVEEVGMKRLLNPGIALVLGLAALAGTAQAATQSAARLKHSRPLSRVKKPPVVRSDRWHSRQSAAHGASTSVQQLRKAVARRGTGSAARVASLAAVPAPGRVSQHPGGRTIYTTHPDKRPGRPTEPRGSKPSGARPRPAEQVKGPSPLPPNVPRLPRGVSPPPRSPHLGPPGTTPPVGIPHAAQQVRRGVPVSLPRPRSRPGDGGPADGALRNPDYVPSSAGLALSPLLGPRRGVATQEAPSSGIYRLALQNSAGAANTVEDLKWNNNSCTKVADAAGSVLGAAAGGWLGAAVGVVAGSVGGPTAAAAGAVSGFFAGAGLGGVLGSKLGDAAGALFCPTDPPAGGSSNPADGNGPSGSPDGGPGDGGPGDGGPGDGGPGDGSPGATGAPGGDGGQAGGGDDPRGDKDQ
jgi:hypothetical protein